MPSYDMLPTFFEPRSFDQVVDFVVNPLLALMAFLRAGYGHGRLIAVVNPCSLLNQEDLIREIVNTYHDNYLMIIPIINDECTDALNVLSKVYAQYRVVNYDPSNPLNSLQDALGIANSRGIIVIRISVNSLGKYVYSIVDEYCDNCGDCLRTNCPAINLSKKPVIDTKACVGCGICQLVCLRGAIVRVKIS
ncbi:hypothetical protein [Vulcanisaeta sp. JCM 16161]|uniref:indolepyruvate ferredoxin oxidoreductase subunit alpha n=1 Tax=Vulcanisaeta sp. JCM 16161 TaxID=1295372 RepID=UPI000B0DC68E|nr:hypothetical protein [Vulcanisaeta sp. JCM 16161]